MYQSLFFSPLSKKMFINNILIVGLVAKAATSPLLALAFTSGSSSCRTHKLFQLEAESSQTTRGDFLSTAAIATTVLVNPIQPAYARGRATLEPAYEKYAPRIIEGGKFYKSQLYGAVSKGDWKAIEVATREPPKKTKADRALADGGVAARAAQAGGFSDAKVLTAMDLLASQFSDNSISPKTKAMRAEVETLREVVQGLNKAARLGSGEDQAKSGLFGGSKGPSSSELKKQVQELYLKGGNAYNQYIYACNDGLPIQLNKLPFL